MAPVILFTQYIVVVGKSAEISRILESSPQSVIPIRRRYFPLS